MQSVWPQSSIEDSFLVGLPLGLEPSTSCSIHLFIQSLCSFRNTCPYHQILFRCSTDNVSSIHNLSLFYLNVTHPSDHTHYWYRWSDTSFSFLTCHVSLPCNMHACMHEWIKYCTTMETERLRQRACQRKTWWDGVLLRIWKVMETYIGRKLKVNSSLQGKWLLNRCVYAGVDALLVNQLTVSKQVTTHHLVSKVTRHSSSQHISLLWELVSYGIRQCYLPLPQPIKADTQFSNPPWRTQGWVGLVTY